MGEVGAAVVAAVAVVQFFFFNPEPEPEPPPDDPVICEGVDLEQIYVELWSPLYGFQPDPWNPKVDLWSLRIQVVGGWQNITPYVDCEAPVEVFIRPHQIVGIPPPDLPVTKIISTTLLAGGEPFRRFGFAQQDYPYDTWFYHWDDDGWCEEHEAETLAAKVKVNGGDPPLGNQTQWLTLPRIVCQ